MMEDIMRIKALLLTLPLIITTGCNKTESDIYLSKPKDTNLEFWITERVTYKDFENKGCTYLPGWMGAEEYLDSRYTAETSEGMAVAPDIHVTYLLTGYPDLLDETAVTHIEITDPTITVYGLTFESSERETSERLHKISNKSAYITTVDECYDAYQIKNCWFHFMSDRIIIDVPTTNKDGIVY